MLYAEFGAFGVATLVRSRASLMRFVSISTDRMRHLDEIWRCMRSKEWIGGLPSLPSYVLTMDQRGFPSRRVHVDRTENSYVTDDAIFCM